jgi:DNA-binding NtrC family response regulator
MKKIFLVEDSRIVAGLLKFELENEFDCEVFHFENKQELMENISLQPDLVILDYFLDGVYQETASLILEDLNKITPSIPVIIFSGQHNLKLAVDLIQAGAMDYIDKNEETFLEDINKAVGNILAFSETKTKLKKIEKRVALDRKQVITWGVVGLVLILTLFIV